MGLDTGAWRDAMRGVWGQNEGGKRWGPKMKTKKAGEKNPRGEGVAPKFYISNVLFVGFHLNVPVHIGKYVKKPVNN